MSERSSDDLPRLDRGAFSVRPLYAENDEKQYWAEKTPQERRNRGLITVISMSCMA